jgi:hypothetical protein
MRERSWRVRVVVCCFEGIIHAQRLRWRIGSSCARCAPGAACASQPSSFGRQVKAPTTTQVMERMRATLAHEKGSLVDGILDFWMDLRTICEFIALYRGKGRIHTHASILYIAYDVLLITTVRLQPLDTGHPGSIGSHIRGNRKWHI